MLYLYNLMLMSAVMIFNLGAMIFLNVPEWSKALHEAMFPYMFWSTVVITMVYSSKCLYVHLIHPFYISEIRWRIWDLQGFLEKKLCMNQLKEQLESKLAYLKDLKLEGQKLLASRDIWD